MDTKVCRSCKLTLPLTQFYKQKDGVQGVKSWCKQCANAKTTERMRIYRKNNPTKNKENQAKHKRQRLEKGLCKHCSRPILPARKVCEWHCLVDLAATSLGRANSALVEALLKKYKSNPVCPYTGEKLIIGLNAHLDHIYPGSRYPELKDTLDNVEWISEKANLAKNDMTKNEFIYFCKLVSSRF